MSNPHKKREKSKKIDLETTLIDLQDAIADLSPKERAQQESAEKIYTTLKAIVDQKNEKAHAYQAEFNRRLSKRINDKGKKQLLEKYFGTSDPKEVIKKMFDENNKKNYSAYKEEEKTLEKKEQNTVFEIFKRAYNKELGMHQGNDIDKKAIEFLLKKSGFYFNKKKRENIFPEKKELKHGESLEKGMTVDSGGTITGIKIEGVEKNIKGKLHKTLIGSKVILDEHGDQSKQAKTTNRPTSTTHIIHTLLRSLNKIPPQEKQHIQRFVDFIDIIDGFEYQASGIDYENQHKTLFGLHNQLPIEDIYKYFEKPQNTGFEILSDKQLENNKITKTYRKNGKRVNEEKTWKQLSESHKNNMEENAKKYGKIDSRGLMLNGTRFTVIFDDEVPYAAQAGSYHLNGIFKLGINKKTKQPYLYIFNPYKEFTQPLGGIEPNGHFIHKDNIDKETLQKVLNECGHTNDYKFKKTAKKQTKVDIIQYLDNINTTSLPEIDIKKLKIGEILTGISKNSNNGHIHVQLGQNISGVIKKGPNTKDIDPGKSVKVKIIKITPTENNKTYIELQRIA